MRLSRATLLAGLAALVIPSAALSAGVTYKGHVGTDKSQTLKFRVVGGKVRGFVGVVYATCFSGGMLTTVTIPDTRLKGKKFSAVYQPVKGSQTFVYASGTVSGARATGTISETGACSFNKQKWTVKRG